MNTVGTILAAARPPPTPLQFLQAALSLATVVLQIMVLFLAIRLGRHHTTAAFRYLMWACICGLGNPRVCHRILSWFFVWAANLFSPPVVVLCRHPDFPDCVPRVSHTRDKMLYS